MFEQTGPWLLLSVLVPLLLWAVGLAVTAYVGYRVVRAAVRDGIRDARTERGPGQFDD